MARLDVSRTTIYRMVNDGTLTLDKIGARSRGITAASLEAIATDDPSGTESGKIGANATMRAAFP